jgi:hypothetical protein
MDHFGSGVLVLVSTGIGNGENFTSRSFPDQIARWIFHSNTRPDVAINPFHDAILLDLGSFGNEVVNIFTPVLDSGISNSRPFLDDNLDNCCVKR